VADLELLTDPTSPIPDEDIMGEPDPDTMLRQLDESRNSLLAAVAAANISPREIDDAYDLAAQNLREAQEARRDLILANDRARRAEAERDAAKREAQELAAELQAHLGGEGDPATDCECAHCQVAFRLREKLLERFSETLTELQCEFETLASVCSEQARTKAAPEYPYTALMAKAGALEEAATLVSRRNADVDKWE
jgi:hypothetical protein